MPIWPCGCARESVEKAITGLLRALLVSVATLLALLPAPSLDLRAGPGLAYGWCRGLELALPPRSGAE